jgi:dipeptidyl aminopeptidase/acylaminoacyl peptidase
MAHEMGFSDVAWDQDGSLVWLEVRSGHGVLVLQPPDGQAPRELNAEHSVRAKLGYGGGDFTVGNGVVYYVEADSGRLYRQPLAHGPAEAVTPAFGHAAAPVLSPDGKWLLFVHSFEDLDALAIVDSCGRVWPQKLNSTHDFYMQPVWHPGGTHIAWIAWDHPNMPWDGTHLFMGRLQYHQDHIPVVEEIQSVAGDVNISIFQPEFSPDGRYLAYVSDESGWWQLYIHDLESGEHRQVTHGEAEYGLPAWVQGLRTYAFGPQGDLIFIRNREGFFSLWRIDPNLGEEQRLHLDDSYSYLGQIRVSQHGIALLASGAGTPQRVVTCHYPDFDQVRIWRRSTTESLSADSYSQPASIAWQNDDGTRAYGLYYPPCNGRFEGSGEPPLIVHIHGGPTSQVTDKFNLRAQFFTSRGYAVLEVNYRGSTGYGREYRNLLRGNWGLYDVQDAVSGAKFLASRGLVDEKRLVIMGGSAGGFTVLKALEDFPGTFKAGICLYGVSNQFTLAAETHKFEAHYSDTLLGPLPGAAEVYRQRSPIFFVDRIQDPLALFQGEDDQVVKREQSDEVAASLQRRGIPHIYHLYAGEGHGFRKADTIEHHYQSIDKFLRQYVIFA